MGCCVYEVYRCFSNRLIRVRDAMKRGIVLDSTVPLFAGKKLSEVEFVEWHRNKS